MHSYLQECEIRTGATVGPFAYLRPGALLREGSKAGTFVEIKNSDIGEGTKVPHLSYVGDADVGPGTNLGAATITANYDGQRKHRTTIGANVRTSVDTTLVAPVTVGDEAYTGGGLGRHGRRARRAPWRSPARARRTSTTTRRAGATARTPSRHERALHWVASMSVQTHPAMATSLPIDYDKRLMLFSGRANPELAARIADKIGVDLGPVTLKTFSNGEVYCRYEESIRGADVFLIQPTCGNPATGVNPNDALMELLEMIDAAVPSGSSFCWRCRWAALGPPPAARCHWWRAPRRGSTTSSRSPRLSRLWQ